MYSWLYDLDGEWTRKVVLSLIYWQLGFQGARSESAVTRPHHQASQCCQIRPNYFDRSVKHFDSEIYCRGICFLPWQYTVHLIVSTVSKNQTNQCKINSGFFPVLPTLFNFFLAKLMKEKLGRTQYFVNLQEDFISSITVWRSRIILCGSSSGYHKRKYRWKKLKKIIECPVKISIMDMRVRAGRTTHRVYCTVEALAPQNWLTSTK
jgi:hypothetical protein